LFNGLFPNVRRRHTLGGQLPDVFFKGKEKRKFEKNIGQCLLPECGRKCINGHPMFFFSTTKKMKKI